MQTARKLVVLVGKFPPRVQRTQDNFHPRFTLFGVNVDGHSTPIVGNGKRAICVQGYVDAVGVSGESFVHAIVDHLLRKVIWARGVGVHTGAFAYRIKSGENFDGRCVVGVASHCYVGIWFME